MESRSKQLTIGAIVIAGLTVMGYASSAVDAWPKVGWTTPNAHMADLEALRAEFITAAAAADQETKEFRTEWRCSEWAEDLEDAYQQQQAGDTSQRLRDKIEGLRERMDDAGCDKYEDY